MNDDTLTDNTRTQNAEARSSEESGKSLDPSDLLQAAEAALAEAEASLRGPKPEPFVFSQLNPENEVSETCSLDMLGDVELDLKIELGRTQMPLADILKLRKGAVVALDRLTDDLVDVYANGRMIARGEVLVLDGNYCIRVTELIGNEPKRTSDSLTNDVP